MPELNKYKRKVLETVSFLKEKISLLPEVVIMLGTGLSGIADQVEQEVVLNYSEIPNFPQSTVDSHSGNLVFGRFSGKNVAILQGRFHYYEGYSTRELTLPVRVLSLLGAKTLILSNAAGGLNPELSSGTLMIIRDHISFIPDNPLRGENVDEWGPRFPDLSKAYDRKLINLAMECAETAAISSVATGVYAAVPGPSLETPAETRFLRNAGADGVGMSTVPEVIVAVHAGMSVLGISVISNVNDPDDFEPIILEDVIEKMKLAEKDVSRMIFAVLQNL